MTCPPDAAEVLGVPLLGELLGALREVPGVRVLWELLLARASEWNESGPRAR
jgi:hypothetical protein